MHYLLKGNEKTLKRTWKTIKLCGEGSCVFIKMDRNGKLRGGYSLNQCC